MQFLTATLLSALLLCFSPSSLTHAASNISSTVGSNSSLPIIDLGYVHQQATYVTENGKYHVFKNIRFAAPPLGDLRFRTPQPPLVQNEVYDGSEFLNDSRSTCHQFLGPQLYGEVPGVPKEGIAIGSEDCLFLDVWVPVQVKATDKVPVLGWWYPGGYYIGSKDYAVYGTPEPLLDTAKEPFIFVAANYRIGGFGWLAPNNGEITPNVGLYDVRMAMEWVGNFIGNFGGDNSRFTVMGDSAGTGSIAHALTSYGGEGAPLPFQQVILQSAVWNPEPASRAGRDRVYNIFLQNANCTTLACLRAAPTEALQAANVAIGVAIASNPPDLGVGVGPVVDGTYVPDQLQNLLAAGKAHPIKSIISSNTRYEGRLDVGAVNETFLDATLRYDFPDSKNSTIAEIEALWPNDGTALGEYDRTVDFETDITAACNSRWFADAYSSSPSSGSKSLGISYRFIFNVGAAFHGADNIPEFYPYTNATDLLERQWITEYITTGNPGPQFVEYGATRQATWLNDTTPAGVLAPADDPWAVGNPVGDARCGFLAARKQYV